MPRTTSKRPYQIKAYLTEREFYAFISKCEQEQCSVSDKIRTLLAKELALVEHTPKTIEEPTNLRLFDTELFAKE